MNLGEMITTNYGLGEFQKERLNEVKKMYSDLINYIDNNLAPSRETSLAITKLQEALMWTTRSISVEATDPFSQN